MAMTYDRSLTVAARSFTASPRRFYSIATAFSIFPGIRPRILSDRPVQPVSAIHKPIRLDPNNRRVLPCCSIFCDAC